MEKSKEPIRLRQRKTPNGLTSLYLDIYLNGKRSYEYLRLYLVPEKTREDKKKNKETLQLAEAIRAKRVVELRNGSLASRVITPRRRCSSTIMKSYVRSVFTLLTTNRIGGTGGHA